MPTNVTIEYLKAEDEYRDAKTPSDRLHALEKMLSTIPKHKGTEKMALQIKRKIARLKKEAEQREAKKSGGKGFNIRKEGAAQVVLVGPPNAGKSSLLKALTNADVAVGDYAFTTLELTPGMLQINDIQIQLVEVPGLIDGVSMGKGMGLQLLSSVRSADALIFVVDASNYPMKQMETTLKELEVGGIKVNKKRPDIEVKKKAVGGISIAGAKHINADIRDVKEILIDFRISSGLLVVREDVSLTDIQEALDYSTSYKNGFVVLNKYDRAEGDVLGQMRKRYPNFLFIATSVHNGVGLKEISKEAYKIANIKRIFTKTPGEKRAYPPVAMKKDANVLAVAKKVHKTIARNFKYARIWGSSVKFDGQRVGEDHIPDDGDTVEIHIK